LEPRTYHIICLGRFFSTNYPIQLGFFLSRHNGRFIPGIHPLCFFFISKWLVLTHFIKAEVCLLIIRKGSSLHR
jgi:hypothetical protein